MNPKRALLGFVLSLFTLVTYALPPFSNATNYDIVYHRISISVDPTSGNRAISNGSVTTYFKTTVANVSSLQFDLDGALTVSSATYHGSAITKSHNTTTDILTLTLPSAIATTGTLDSVTVFYSGSPAVPTTSIPSGYNVALHATGQYAIYTLDESFTAHFWWPCKESLYDKIDSVDLIVTTPSAYRVASNGVVSESVSSGTRTTTWKNRYRIATYGINFAVANYSLYTFNITSAVSGRTFPVNNYFYPEDNTATFQGYANQLQTIIPQFESKLNVAYPFDKEQYGLAECTGNWGALEVQSMTFIAKSSYNDNGYTIAHEAAHQWFGDMATTNSWQQVWLNEGFAQYFQNFIYPETVRTGDIQARRTASKNAVTSGTRVFVTDTSNADRIFFGNGTPAAQPYDKGAMMISMLRTWIGDAGFFNGLHDYLLSPGAKYNFGAVDSLKKYMQTYTPNNLDNFFSNWVNKPGYTSYVVTWGKSGNYVNIKLAQSVAGGGTGYYDMPVPIRITNGTGLDTTVVIIDRGGVLYNSVTGATLGASNIRFKLSQSPTTLSVDPLDLVLTDASSITYNTALPVRDVSLKASPAGKQVKIGWTVSAADELAKVELERSVDGVNFLLIKSFPQRGIVSENVQGNFTDAMVSSSQYYRIKTIEKGGEVRYSKTERVNGNERLALELAPNPVTAKLTVTLPPGFTDGSTLTVQNMGGQAVKQLRLQPGSSKIEVEVNDIPSGLYVAILEKPNKETMEAHFIKQ